MASNVLDAKANPLRATSSIDYNAYLELSRVKNRAGILLIFWPFAWGLVMSAKTLNLPLDVVLRFLGWGMIGSFLLHSAGCIWDDIVDRNLDAQVERTKKRPLPSGRVSVRGALVWMTVNIIPLLALILPSNPLARTIGLVSVFPLAGLYPFMKRVTYWPQAWLGLTLNTGVVAAWAYTSGSYPMSALVLSGGAWAWTLWYDTIYACQDRKDDLKAGIKSTAVLFASRTKLAIALFGLILISALYAAGVLNNQGYAYFVVSVGGATADLIMQLSEIDFERTESCGRAFHRNGYTLGSIVFFGIFLDYALTCLV
ncbi:4-hydroxybenzoate polyprenyltransferase, mitochondrial [Pleurotus pulmonarius]